MTFTIMAVDLVFKFRLVAFDHTCLRREKWQLEVLSIQDVAEVLITLGFIDAETAERLAKGKSTVTPQSGVSGMAQTYGWLSQQVQ